METSSTMAEEVEPLVPVTGTEPRAEGSPVPASSSSTAPGIALTDLQPAPQAQSGQLHLLYSDEAFQEPYPVALAKRVQRAVVHGHSVASGQGAFEVVEVLDGRAVGPDQEPLLPGVFLIWPLNCTSSKLGTTAEEIKFRIPGKTM